MIEVSWRFIIVAVTVFTAMVAVAGVLDKIIYACLKRAVCGGAVLPRDNKLLAEVAMTTAGRFVDTSTIPEAEKDAAQRQFAELVKQAIGDYLARCGNGKQVREKWAGKENSLFMKEVRNGEV